MLDAYGEEFENVKGDIVKLRYEDQTEQVIELIIPLKPEYEDAPDDIDVTKDGEEIKLILSDEILFEFGESDVTGEGEQVIQEIADWLESDDYAGLIKIHCPTDNVSGNDINQPLSEDRAENVHALFLSNLKNDSVFEFEVEVEGFGQYEPIATNEETDEGRQRNRRVEILLQGEAAEK
ncbi:OmpA family protein [Oceanobacillus alkalisoli]|uniref:OmpA family protein n=1 Tax=Oceanobacillus alkalisoli TaxID=2925113 RepID=UPI001EF0C509|nr:OmpA family protein [Oceanobacillus alkalisoli]MCF3943691.1 OmpA family protein [Oceanobacillus alkalisoli]MCG5104102.1 OmpA family protein [Oceanobacillus alkalisoli]